MATVESAHLDLTRLQEAVNEAKRDEAPELSNDGELEALAELVPGLKTRRASVTSGKLEDDTTFTPAMRQEDHPDAMHVTSESPHAKSYQPNENLEESSDAGDDDFDSPENDDVLYSNEGGNLVGSDHALSSDHSKTRPAVGQSVEDMGLGGDFQNMSSGQSLSTATQTHEVRMGLGGDFQNMSSGQSLSTATQTHEVRMPMYLPTFKPATGCTNASDFIVRCFVARLRSGITVVKHGRSRWCKSRLRILHIHPDGRSLSWKPAVGEPTSSKRPPKLDLATCLEVRHAWSPDPQNPMYTGTPILRQKCEAANAHKSFALIFPKRTVDFTSVTADQCKVLMEGFSALCFRLQVANLAGNGNKGGQKMPDEEEAATTASATLTNNSSPAVGQRR